MAHVSRAEQLARIRIEAARARLPELERQWDQWQRGGFPTTSMAEGSRSAETPLPVNKWGNANDKLDRDIKRARRKYEAHLREIAEHLFEMQQIEQAWIPPDEKTEPKRYRKWVNEMSERARNDVSPGSVECANPHCRRIIERTANDPVRSGRCGACYRFWKRALGTRERPRALCEASPYHDAEKTA